MGLLGFVDVVQDGEDLNINQLQGCPARAVGATRPRATAAGDGPSVTSGASAGNYLAGAGN